VRRTSTGSTLGIRTDDGGVGGGAPSRTRELSFNLRRTTSTSEARRQIKGGGLKVNDVTVTDEKMALSLKQLTPEGVIKLSLGRKKHVLLKPV